MVIAKAKTKSNGSDTATEMKALPDALEKATFDRARCTKNPNKKATVETEITSTVTPSVKAREAGKAA